jgi:hypothetical protein
MTLSPLISMGLAFGTLFAYCLARGEIMMKEEILFVTKATNEWDEGFSYVLELAQTLKAGIVVLMVVCRRFQDTYCRVKSKLTHLCRVLFYAPILMVRNAPYRR